MIGKIVKSEDFQKKLIISSRKKQYNSKNQEINIKNKNLEFGDIFSDLDTISKYRTGTINYICFSGKENVDENGTVINLTFPENLKEINSIKLIVALNDFEVYTEEVLNSIFVNYEIEANEQLSGVLLEQNSNGDYSSDIYIHNPNIANNEIKDYIRVDKITTKTTNAISSGILYSPNNFRTFTIDNIIWRNLDDQDERNKYNHSHDFNYLANMLSGFDHNHSFISENHNHSYSLQEHIHKVDSEHKHNIKLNSHLHSIKTNHYHIITGEDLFYKNFNATTINIQEINKTYNINGNTNIDLSDYKSNFSNKMTLKTNAKCNITYFLILELYCLDT